VQTLLTNPYIQAAKGRVEQLPRIGVDPRLSGEVPCDLLRDEDYLQAVGDIGKIHDAYWTYPREVLENKFHVTGIKEMRTWRNTREIQQHSLSEKVFLAKGCGT